MSNTTLILGGARSGKSRYALSMAEKSSDSPSLIATAEALDEEMQSRIVRHKQERGAHWTTIECAVDVVQALTELAPHETVVIDCLTLWLSNLMHGGKSPQRETERLSEAIKHAPQRLIFVSNEVGLGLVPETELGRDFRDAQGRLNQAVAEFADEVFFLAAGLPLQLK